MITGRRAAPAFVAAAALVMAMVAAPVPLRSQPAAAAGNGPTVVAFGDARAPGTPESVAPRRPIVGMAATPDGGGYWLVASDGGIFAFGDAQFFGSTGGLVLRRPIVGMAATQDGAGYWLVASDGGVFAFGDARFFGSTGGLTLRRPVVGMAATSDGGGYWLVASDGGVFAFGDARFFGSTGGLTLRRPVVGMAATPDGAGYWMVASDGGIFAFGDAGFLGSAVDAIGARRVAAGMTTSPTGKGYTVLGVDAGVRVGFAGDVHGDGRVATVLANGGNPLDPMRSAIAADDATMVNLETAVGSGGTRQVKQYTFQASPELVKRLHDAGVTVVNLANNHSLDFGPSALLETIGHARDAGLLTVGAGADDQQAYAPAVVTTPGGTVAFLGLSQVVPAGWAAGPGHPGVASAYNLNAATAAVRAARSMADHVVVMIHAGVELATCPTGMQRDLAAALVGAGADVVAGGHPHVLQGITMSGSSLIDYSLGNFVWYGSSSATDPTGLLSVNIGPGGVAGYDFAPARIDGNGSPQPLDGQAADDARANLASLAPGAGRC